MHGEARHLNEHAKLARAAGIGEVLSVRNGDIVRLAPGAAAVVDQAPTGRLFRDGRLLIASEEGPLRQRRALAFAGIVIVALTLSSRGELLANPQITLDGVPSLAGAEGSMLEQLLDVVEDTLRSIPPGRRRDGETVREAVRRAVRARVEDLWGKRPITKVLLTQLGPRG
jgi:ribonuclease J